MCVTCWSLKMPLGVGIRTSITLISLVGIGSLTREKHTIVNHIQDHVHKSTTTHVHTVLHNLAIVPTLTEKKLLTCDSSHFFVRRTATTTMRRQCAEIATDLLPRSSPTDMKHPDTTSFFGGQLPLPFATPITGLLSLQIQRNKPRSSVLCDECDNYNSSLFLLREQSSNCGY